MGLGTAAAGVVLAGAGLLALLAVLSRRRPHDLGYAEHPGLEIRLSTGPRRHYVITVRHVRRAPRPIWRIRSAELLGWPSARVALVWDEIRIPPAANFWEQRIELGRLLPAAATFAPDLRLLVRAGRPGEPPPEGASVALLLSRADGESWICRAPLTLD